MKAKKVGSSLKRKGESERREKEPIRVHMRRIIWLIIISIRIIYVQLPSQKAPRAKHC